GLVRELGASDLPRPDRDGFDRGPAEWYETYLDFVRNEIRVTGESVRVDATLEPDHSAIPSHLELLPHLSHDARSRLTAEYLRIHPEQQHWAWRQTGGRQSTPVTVVSP